MSAALQARRHRLAIAAVGLLVSRRAAPRRVEEPIPVVLLARLALDTSLRGRGLGAWLLRDAMERALAASQAVGIRAMLVHALDEDTREFYLHHGLEPSPTDPLHLMILIKDIEAAIRASDRAR